MGFLSFVTTAIVFSFLDLAVPFVAFLSLTGDVPLVMTTTSPSSGLESSDSVSSSSDSDSEVKSAGALQLALKMENRYFHRRRILALKRRFHAR